MFYIVVNPNTLMSPGHSDSIVIYFHIVFFMLVRKVRTEWKKERNGVKSDKFSLNG